jgi:hypothetical protein
MAPYASRSSRGMVGCTSDGVNAGEVMPQTYADSYEVVINIWLDGNQWGALVGENITTGIAGFGYSVNEAMVELTKEMERYHRNWQEFAEPD